MDNNFLYFLTFVGSAVVVWSGLVLLASNSEKVVKGLRASEADVEAKQAVYEKLVDEAEVVVVNAHLHYWDAAHALKPSAAFLMKRVAYMVEAILPKLSSGPTPGSAPILQATGEFHSTLALAGLEKTSFPANAVSDAIQAVVLAEHQVRIATEDGGMKAAYQFPTSVLALVLIGVGLAGMGWVLKRVYWGAGTTPPPAPPPPPPPAPPPPPPEVMWVESLLGPNWPVLVVLLVAATVMALISLWWWWHRWTQ